MASATQATFSFGAFPILRTERLDLLELGPRFVDDIFAVRSDHDVQLYNSVPHQTRDDTFRFIAERRQKYCAARSYSRRRLGECLRFGSLPPAPLDQRPHRRQDNKVQVPRSSALRDMFPGASSC